MALIGYLEQSVRPLPALVLFAVLEARAGRRETAIEWIGLLRSQPSINRGAMEWLLHYHLEEITDGMSAAEVEAALARGAKLDLDEVIRGLEARAQAVKRS
jgi:hypothetical protein